MFCRFQVVHMYCHWCHCWHLAQWSLTYICLVGLAVPHGWIFLLTIFQHIEGPRGPSVEVMDRVQELHATLSAGIHDQDVLAHLISASP